VFASTGGAIYGECKEPAREDSPREPLSPYGTAKLAAEEYLRSYNRLYGTRHIALRYGNVYGPRQDPHGEAGVVAIFLGALARGEQARIFGDGLQTRDYVYVGDVARATTSTVGQDLGVFNVGTGRETSVVELYELCARVAGSDAPAEHAPGRLGELSELPRSWSSRPRVATSASAMVDLEDGLAATCWIRQNWKELSKRAGESDRPWITRRLPALVRPWRTAAYVAVAVAAVELLLLLSSAAALTGFVRSHRARGARPGAAPIDTTQAEASPSHKTAPVAKRPRSKTVVLVLNGNGRTGAAASAASRVQSRGYKIGEVTNAPELVPRSIVMYKPGFAGEGRRLGQDLGVKLMRRSTECARRARPRARRLHSRSLAQIRGIRACGSPDRRTLPKGGASPTRRRV
jgi:hypothetical protein